MPSGVEVQVLSSAHRNREYNPGGRLAQLVRALRLHRKCRGFKSLSAHTKMNNMDNPNESSPTPRQERPSPSEKFGLGNFPDLVYVAVKFGSDNPGFPEDNQETREKMRRLLKIPDVMTHLG